jgi:hypothetical protein
MVCSPITISNAKYSPRNTQSTIAIMPPLPGYHYPRTQSSYGCVFVHQ